mgnify:CR=1 FL=1
MPKAAVVQMSSDDNLDKNLSKVNDFVSIAVAQGAEIVFLPENFFFMGKSEKQKLELAENYGHGKIQDTLTELSRDKQVWIVGGTLPIKTDDPNKIYAASIVWDNQGEFKACYHKIHLFDVQLPGKNGAYLESETIQSGHDIVSLHTPIGKLGLTVCYDIRFPELYRKLTEDGASCFSIASAFTKLTGQAHWEVLCRARAVENGAYVLAANQTGAHPNQRESFGHSMIVSPDGKILKELKKSEGVITVSIDQKLPKKLRSIIPSLKSE